MARATQVRAGNAMQRARAEILAAAADLVAAGGLAAVTMAALARRAAVAKATVYNHFRDRDDVVHALLETEGERIVAHCAAAAPDDRLAAAAQWLSSSSVVNGLRRHNPDTLISVARRAATAPRVRQVVSSWCDADAEADGAGDSDTDSALRWLVSFVVVPDESGESPSIRYTRP